MLDSIAVDVEAPQAELNVTADTRVVTETSASTLTTSATLFTDPSRGAVVAEEGNPESAIGLSLSAEQRPSIGTVVDEAVMQYETAGDTQALAIMKDDASIQYVITISSAADPEHYPFDLDLPAGAVAEVNPDGAVVITSDSGESLGGVAPPWAIDADRRAIPSRLELREGQVVQIVEHATPSTTYPVVADPYLGKAGLLTVPWVA